VTELRDTLDRILATAQAEQRIPSVSAAVFRDGEVMWRSALGSADVGRGEDATTEHAYRIGSITKTFTAVCILQLRDAMVLDLDDSLRTHIPEAPVGLTIRDALAHLSGLQREPPGEIWETLTPPSREELLGGLEDAERVLRHAVIRAPELGRTRKRVERRLAEVERERVGLGARARVHENGCAGPLAPVDAERREESGHRPSVPDVHALAATVEAKAEPPAE